MAWDRYNKVSGSVLSENQQLELRMRAVLLYIDFIVDYKIKKATGYKFFSWEFGKLYLSKVEITENDVPMTFEEFNGWLHTAYILF